MKTKPDCITTAGNRCPICDSASSTAFFVTNGYTIVQCETCSGQYVCPMPSENDLRAHYQDPAYFCGEDHQGYRNYGDMRKAVVPHFKSRLGKIVGHLPQRGRLLDLGCAAGYFLEIAKSDGWQIAGVELSSAMARSASQLLGIPVVTSLDALEETGFDAVTLWEVVEHLPRPIADLCKLRGLLRPGGVLMLSTPNVRHWQAVREPQSWHAYCPPSHLVYFTPQALTNALATAGFDNINVRRVSPLPPLPPWLRRLSAPLAGSLASGQAKHWPIALILWRVVRLFGLCWWAVAHREDDVFATLEATAFRPL